MPSMMKAAVFVEPGRIEVVDKPIPDVGPNDALIRITTTTICGTDVHILKGEYPVAKGLTIGHEPVGIIEKLGSAVVGYQEGQRVIAGAAPRIMMKGIAYTKAHKNQKCALIAKKLVQCQKAYIGHRCDALG